MTINDEILWLEERLRAMDPNLNLNSGSPATVQVIEPFRRRFRPDPLESSVIPFIVGRLRQEYPNITAEEGDAFIDLMVKPMSILLEPFRREIRAIKRNQSIADPSIINSDEADALLANTFFIRSAGAYSRGKVRIYFANPVTLVLGTANVAYTNAGRRYLLSQSQSITSEAMLLNTEGSLYYWDVDYVAEGTGTAYDIGPNQIVGVTGIASATKATNPYKFSGGVSEQSTSEVIAVAEENIGERSLNTVPGAVAKLFDEFADLRILQIIGFNDAEMERDVITGGSLGDVVLHYNDGLAPDDGDGYASTFTSAQIAAAGPPYNTTFTAYFGPVGTDISEYTITIWHPVGGVSTPVDYQLGEVDGAGMVSIHSSYTHTARIPTIAVGTEWSIRKREILLSDIPGGILFPDVNGNQLSVEPDRIHVGGCSDYYVDGTTHTDQTMAITAVEDRTPVVKGLFLETFGATATPDRAYVTMTNDQYDAVVAGSSMLRIIDTASGNNLGTYPIVHKVTYAAGAGQFILDVNLVAPNETGSFCEIVDDIDVELLNPYEVVVEGTDLRTYAGLSVVDTAAVTNFTDYGMTVVGTDNKLIILSGNDAGTYEITSVAATTLTLPAPLTDTAGPIGYRVVREYAEAIDLPLRTIRKLEMLDASSEPNGNIIPYRHPIDAQSRRFANIGRTPKAGEGTTANDTLTTVLLTNIVHSSLGGMNYWNRGVRLFDVLNINQGSDRGYYLVIGVGGGPGPIGLGLNPDQLRLSVNLNWSAGGLQYTVGEPSVGSFRTYFLNPCSATMDYDTTLFSTLVGETAYRFRPDPTMYHEYLPTETTVPTAEMAVANLTDILLWTPDGATAIRAWNHDVQAGDYAEITYAPITGVVDLTAPVGALDGKSILVDLGSGSERVTFDAVAALTGAEIVSQINAQLSSSVASLYATGGLSLLRLRADAEITLKDNTLAPGAGDCTVDLFGAVRATYMPWLAGSFVGQDTNNDSHLKAKWTIVSVNAVATERATLELGIDEDGNAYANTQNIPSDRGHYVRISRRGRQHISAVTMADNVDDLGMYYWDVECTSEGHGDSWNISPDLESTVTGYQSEGWEMSVEDDTLSFSLAEEPWVHLSPRVLFAGDDDPANFTTLMSDSFQIEYDQEDIVEMVHSFIRSPSERTVNNNPLARGLTPTLVRTAIYYAGGYTETTARAKIAELIKGVMPNRQLDVSDMVQILVDSGSDFVTLPITVVGISHGVDRNITVERSENFISNDRLSVLVPDDDGTTTEGNSYIALTRS